MPDEQANPRVTIREVTRETPDACSVVLEAPAGADFSYQPGQFVTLRLPTSNGLVGRCYSLCSSPHVDDELRIAVKRVREGVASNWINDALTVGAEIECLPPGGVFTPKSLDDDLLLFAGGSGVTPVLSILKSALAVGSGQVVLVYANQNEQSVIFARTTPTGCMSFIGWNRCKVCRAGNCCARSSSRTARTPRSSAGRVRSWKR